MTTILPSSEPPVLRVRGLKTVFGEGEDQVAAVNDMSLSVHRGETLAIVGESGSGKSVLAYSIMGLIDPPGRIVQGEILLGDRDLARLTDESLRAIRGSELAIVFQEPSTSLNPLMTVGKQVAEAIHEHEPDVSSRDAMARVIERFRLVGIPAPEQRIHEYPHQLSGGMRQRVMIAMALACRPALLIADEPTTALDVTVQAQVLNLIASMNEAFGMAVILITHDLAIVADQADRVIVMYAGRKVEEGTAKIVLERPGHPYTRALMACRLDVSHALSGEPLIEIPGVVPSLDRLPAGCAFANRCSYVQEQCRRQRPELVEIESGHLSACFFADEIANGRRTPSAQAVMA
jgi:oligopeptide/dipeptide ABC transporter ATP-binding protein